MHFTLQYTLNNHYRFFSLHNLPSRIVFKLRYALFYQILPWNKYTWTLYNTVHYNTVLDITRIRVGPQIAISDFFSYIIYAFYCQYNTDWIANMEIGLDPNNSVIKRLWCTFFDKKMFGLAPIYDVLTRSSYALWYKTEISRMGENRGIPCWVCKNIRIHRSIEINVYLQFR